MGVLFFCWSTAWLSITGERTTFSLKDKIGVVVLKGMILDSKAALNQLEKYVRDEGIKAIILRIESPGGRCDAGTGDLRKKSSR